MKSHQFYSLLFLHSPQWLQIPRPFCSLITDISWKSHQKVDVLFWYSETWAIDSQRYSVYIFIGSSRIFIQTGPAYQKLLMLLFYSLRVLNFCSMQCFFHLSSIWSSRRFRRWDIKPKSPYFDFRAQLFYTFTCCLFTLQQYTAWWGCSDVSVMTTLRAAPAMLLFHVPKLASSFKVRLF